MANDMAKVGAALVGGAFGASALSGRGRKKRRAREHNARVQYWGQRNDAPDQNTLAWREFDRYGVLNRALQTGQSGQDFIAELMNTHRGDENQLAEFLERTGVQRGALAAKDLKSSQAMQYLDNQSNWDMGALSAQGLEAGMIGRGMRQQATQGSQALGAAGLGRSSLRGALGANIMQQGISQQSNSYAAAQMRAAENRMASARTAFDAHRQIAQLALGQAPTPRDPGGGPSTAMSGIAGALSGAGALASLGPMGALAGGAIGGIAGLLGGK